MSAPECCPVRLTVTPRCGAPHGGGYACRATGGHCLPDSKCDDRRRAYAAFTSAETRSELDAFLESVK